MSFTREVSRGWHREIPGARWFKADLHVHTIDDHAGGRAKWPAGMSGDPESPDDLKRYARAFVQAVVRAGIQVVGLTPHSPRAGSDPRTSAVWHIVDTWNHDEDDDGTAFRDKIYAVFPGFEPSFREGQEGLHLLFLFDPEIGLDDYLGLHAAFMGAISPWSGNRLNVSSDTAERAFETLRTFRERQCPSREYGADAWGVLILAPHVDSPKGLFGAEKSQILELFHHRELAGLELPDDSLPGDLLAKKPWLNTGMAKYRHGFYHASDAYEVAGSEASAEQCIGHRYTWIKLASPRIEALRQAFLASDSRMRIAYARGDDGSIVERPDSPDVSASGRPWLRSVTIRGQAAFFRGETPSGLAEARFDLSPDLTCLIGGSMTGKSTFLDGLRVHVEAPPPKERALAQNVTARGQGLFLAGAPEVVLECPGRDPTAPRHERWPAVFFAQSELSRVAQDAGAVEDILARLAPAEAPGIEERKRRLEAVDRELGELAGMLDAIDDEVAESEQAYQRAVNASKEISAFGEAGVEQLQGISTARQTWAGAAGTGRDLSKAARELLNQANALPVVSLDAATEETLQGHLPPGLVAGLPGLRDAAVGSLERAVQAIEDWVGGTSRVEDAVDALEKETRRTVEQKLAAMGYQADRLREFQALSHQVSLLSSYEANLTGVRDRARQEEARFEALLQERTALVTAQREAFDRVVRRIDQQFAGRIGVRRIEEGQVAPLERFLQGLKQKGVTQWWNQKRQDEMGSPSPVRILDTLDGKCLGELGMSQAVSTTFSEAMSRKKRRELAGVRCPDLYELHMRVAPGEERRLTDLSGGQRVSLLLSLLLETADERPLVVDQPEDELDNRFLWETVLPVLRRLKGRRQVIVATHNANIVVNGDADQVIALEATAHHGWVAVAGAIEDPPVREAIVQTVDGGGEAFLLRQVKYGF